MKSKMRESWNPERLTQQVILPGQILSAEAMGWPIIENPFRDEPN